MQKYSVDIVIPVRSRDEYDILSRLRWRLSYNLPENFNFIIVDYGSNFQEHELIEELCKQNNFNYIYVEEAVNQIWNASKARNIALLNSKADYILFEDVDLLSHKEFYQWINNQIESLIIEGEWPFFVIPVSYLTENGALDINFSLSTKEYNQLTTEILRVPNSDLIAFHAPASSYLVCSREQAISVGGYDESFEGWGFEDSDFWVKLLREQDIEKPREFYRLDTREYSNQVQWRGWRTLFRIYADIIAYKGIYSFHIWHPIAEHRNDNVRKKNHQIFLANMEYYKQENYALKPLWNHNEPTHLFLSRNPHSFNKYLFKVFSNPYLIEESCFDIREIDNLISQLNIESVIFNNPYGNPKRTMIYEEFRSRGINCYVVERGALPWSIYVDNDGFCAESKSYMADHWKDKALTEENLLKTIEYINHLKFSGASLEPQADLIGGSALKRKLFGASENTKVLFVALQSPSDTTTNYFCGPIGSYTNFINEIQKLVYQLGDDWKVMYKNHPLTIDKVNIEGAINVDQYHIGDLLEASDAITLINSGVGVLAAAYMKPVFYFGQAFYACEGINHQVSSAGSCLEALTLLNKENLDQQKSLQLISYLIHDFYSFATWERKERKHTDKANLSISTNIQYNILRVHNLNTEYNFEKDKQFNLINSMLFDRYRLDEYVSRQDKKIPSKTLSKTPSKATPQIVSSEELMKADRVSKLAITNKPKGVSRKIRKMLTNPNAFFADFFLKRIK